ncbi:MULTISPECIES: hypothetical protein [unclassified Solwaraspora]|uniref:hypothetical protein n=1 Tax=unclassified Solwaraspora TaxID=2627926 RepID=UPI00259BE182|nr:hypothetical protein [Solwaraspora sp. WMMA2056]WJK41155.1 hypothetical protein O7608_01455 [Solwaraspora sp. WMMA2056]
MSDVGFAIAMASAALVGFLAGLLSFKVKSRWCPECGAMTYPRPPDGHDMQISNGS